jgi:transketolase
VPSADAAARFTAYGLAVQRVIDVNDFDALTAAFEAFQPETSKPTLIIVDSVIGDGGPSGSGRHSAHGVALARARRCEAVPRFP